MKIRKLFERLLDNWPAKIISVAVALLLFLFYRIVNLNDRYFNIPLQVVMPQNYTAAGEFPRKVRVTLKGKEEDLSHILEEDIEAKVDLTGLNRQGTFREPVEISKKGTALNVDPLEIKVDPMEVSITLEKKLKKSIEVKPSFTGFPAPGYELNQYYITPSTVEIEGPESHVSAMESVKTQNIDLTGKKEDFTVRVPLALKDSLVTVTGGNMIEFHGIIQERIILKTIGNVDIITLDLEPNLVVANTIPRGTIRVQASQNMLSKMEPEQIRLVVDCSQITHPGTYTLPVKPDVPLGLLVLNYDPQNVTYTVRAAEE